MDGGGNQKYRDLYTQCSTAASANISVFCCSKKPELNGNSKLMELHDSARFVVRDVHPLQCLRKSGSKILASNRPRFRHGKRRMSLDPNAWNFGAATYSGNSPLTAIVFMCILGRELWDFQDFFCTTATHILHSGPTRTKADLPPLQAGWGLLSLIELTLFFRRSEQKIITKLS